MVNLVAVGLVNFEKDVANGCSEKLRYYGCTAG
jgi:hypothetical protein